MLALTLLGGCSAASQDPGSSAPTDDRDDAVVASTAATVTIDGDDLLVDVDGDVRRVATVTDAELLHASVRPGHERPLTLLVLAREEGNFELRYLDVVEGEATELFGFPFRLQVDPSTASIADVPPLPVWSPDGQRIAWLEWTPRGTRLRTLGWLTHDQRSNPSEERGDWDLEEVPVGTQLEGWEIEEDGTPVLISRVEAGERWRIRLEDGGPVTAAGPDPRA